MRTVATSRRRLDSGHHEVFTLLVLCAGVIGMTTQTPRKILVAHRGASAYAPEHTLAAYRLALAQGADFVEQDLQISKDSVLVCLHDLTLERTTNVEEMFPERSTVGAKGPEDLAACPTSRLRS